MPFVTTFTPAIAAELVNARRVGSTFREAREAAGVALSTLSEWLRRGRAWNAGERDDAGGQRYADFARDFDAGRSVYLRTLRAHRASGVAKDGRLAHEVIKHEETRELRNEELKLLKERARVEKNRADGTHVERVNVSTREMTDAEILAEARLLAAQIAADLAPADTGGEAPTAH
mgnify:FL=1